MAVRAQTTLGKTAATCFVGAVVGFILIGLPGLVHVQQPKSLFDFVDASVKGLSAAHVALLFAGGFLWGLVLKWPYAAYAAFFQAGSLPAIAVVEMLRDPTSHNLWPFEFLIYLALASISLLGMAIPMFVKRRWLTKNHRLPGKAHE